MYKKILSAAIATGSRGLTVLGGAFFTFIISRNFGLEELGRVALFLSYVTIVAIFLKIGLDTAIIRFIGSQKNPKVEVNINLIDRLLLLVNYNYLARIAVMVLVVIVMDYLKIWESLFKNISLVKFCLSAIFLSSIGFISAILKGVGEIKYSPFFEMGGVNSLSAIMYLFSSKFDPINVIIISQLILLLIGLIILKRYGKQEETYLTKEVKCKFKKFKKNYFEYTAGQISAQITVAGLFIVASHYLTLSEIGSLRIIERLSALVAFPLMIIRPYISGRLAWYWTALDKKRIEKTLMLSALYGIAFAIPLIAAYMITPGVIISLFHLNTQNQEIFYLLNLMTLCQLINLIFLPKMVFLNMANSQREVLHISTMTLLSGSILLPLFTQWAGLNGLIYSIVVLTVVRASLIYFTAKSALEQL